MIIRYDGGEYPFDFDDISVQQAMAIEKYMGCSFDEWGKKLREGGNLRARQVLGWLVLHPEHDDGRSPEALVQAIGATNFKMVKLGMALDDAYAAEEAAVAAREAEAGPVPTAAASTGRKRAAAASSPAS